MSSTGYGDIAAASPKEEFTSSMIILIGVFMLACAERAPPPFPVDQGAPWPQVRVHKDVSQFARFNSNARR